jgi:hypothetical protein
VKKPTKNSVLRLNIFPKKVSIIPTAIKKIERGIINVSIATQIEDNNNSGHPYLESP